MASFSQDVTAMPDDVREWGLSYDIRQNSPTLGCFRWRIDEQNVWACDEFISDPRNPPTILRTDNERGRIWYRARVIPEPIDRGKTGFLFWLFGE